MISPIFYNVKQAQKQLHGRVVRTSMYDAYDLSKKLEAKVFLKAENRQVTGSFKFRGAYNAVSKTPLEECENGILTISSGNHALGVAEASRMLGLSATIIMPSDAPVIKIARTRASGAKVILYDRASEDRDEIARLEIERTGKAFIHPYNNVNVIAGQGTVGLEIVEDLDFLGLKPDVILVCTGGGGLAAGVSLACKTLVPDVSIYAIEPDGFDDYGRSLRSGKIEKNKNTSGSICDAILTPSPGEVGFEINRNRLAGGISVSDREALQAVRYCFENPRMVVEPGGAVALAALLSGKLEAQFGALRGKVIVVILSGGNIDEQVLQKALKTDFS